MKVIELINEAERSGRARFTFELLPPLKGDGTQGVFSAIDTLVEYDPAYINVTCHREDVKLVERENGLLERHIVRRRPGTVGISAAIMRRYGIEAVSGPVGITEVITDAARSSGLDVLNLLIVISINLGVMNLLPLPALDGGHILLYLVEAVRRKPLKPEVEGIINFVGLALLLGLAVIITIKDVIAL